MPMNRFKCDSCDEEWSFIGPHGARPCPACKKEVQPLLPRDITSPAVFETVSKDKNVKWRENFQERAKKRNAAGSKHGAKERARIHNEDPKKHGITEDDPHLI